MAKKPTAATNDPNAELLDLAELLIAAHQEWLADPNGPDGPPEPYWRQAEALIDHACQLDVVLESHAMLIDAVDRLATEQANFDALSMETGTSQPQNEYWLAFETLCKRVESLRREPAKIESVRLLHDRGISHQQIARMYGWIDDNDRPRLDLVDQELDSPGSVTANQPPVTAPGRNVPFGPSPAMVLRRDELQRRDGKRNKPKPQPCPEAPIELWAIGVLSEQAATMLCRPLDDVRRLWQEFTELHGEPDKLSRSQVRRLAEMDVAPEQPAVSAEAAERYAEDSDDRLRERCRAAGIGDTGTRSQLIAKLEAVEALTS